MPRRALPLCCLRSHGPWTACQVHLCPYSCRARCLFSLLTRLGGLQEFFWSHPWAGVVQIGTGIHARKQGVGSAASWRQHRASPAAQQLLSPKLVVPARLALIEEQAEHCLSQWQEGMAHPSLERSHGLDDQ